MKYVAPIRRELGVRTIFNILGPLTNPAGAENQLMGVFHPDLVGIQVRVLKQLGSKHVLIVHGKDGMDEISISGPTLIAELKDGQINEFEFDPRDYGFELADIKTLHANDAEQSKHIIEQVLANQASPCRDIVQLNAGAAIYAAGKAESLAEGIKRAGQVLADGSARARLDALVQFTQSI